MSEGEITIREAGPADVEGFVAGYGWLFEPPGARPEDWNVERAAERLLAAIGSDDAAPLLAAGPGGRIVGICTAYIDLLSVRFGLRCWVEDLAVDPAMRSGGIGARLLSEAREWAAGRGATHLELDSGDARTEAHRFYEREGAAYRSVCFGWPSPERG
jgi:GNAT superfamily N-acetyltransferase